MRFGPKCKRGSLPVYSVGTEEAARMLLTLTCPVNGTRKDEWVSPELYKGQSLEVLQQFSDRLDRMHERMKARGQCSCLTEEELNAKKITRGEERELYDALKRLKRHTDWMEHSLKAVPIKFTTWELIALRDLLKGLKNHFRRLKRIEAKAPANDVA